jgi:hypothetical protein
VCTFVERYFDLRSESQEDVLCAHMTCFSNAKLTLIFLYISRLCFSMMYCVRMELASL